MTQATAVAWIAGTLVALFGGGVVLLLAIWFGRCPKCKSYKGPFGKSWRDTTFEHIVNRKCRECGHEWEERTSFID